MLHTSVNVHSKDQKIATELHRMGYYIAAYKPNFLAVLPRNVSLQTFQNDDDAPSQRYYTAERYSPPFRGYNRNGWEITYITPEGDGGQGVLADQRGTPLRQMRCLVEADNAHVILERKYGYERATQQSIKILKACQNRFQISHALLN